MICELCEREVLSGDESKHHLIPKMVRRKDDETSILHMVCHKQIHALYNEKILARHLNTMSKLKNDMGLKRFIKWIRKKPLAFTAGTRRSNIRR